MKTARLFVAGVALAALLAACGSDNDAGSSPTPADADATIAARQMAFETDTLTVPAGESFTLLFENLEAMPHNVAIYTDASRSEAIFVGDTISDTQIVYEIPALDAGEYYFVCDLHPDMNGTVIAD
jgi:plastocyanin